MSPYLLREEILVLRDKWQGQPSPHLYREISELLFTAGKIPAAMNLMEHFVSPLNLNEPQSSLESFLIKYQEEQEEDRVNAEEKSDASSGSGGYHSSYESEISEGSNGAHPESLGSQGERWFRRGLEYADACLYEEACSCLSGALAMGYDGFETHYCLAGMHKSLGRLSQAESHCRKAMEHNPAFCPAFILLGSIVKLEGRLQESAEAVQKALFIDPDCAPAHYDLACYRALSGEIDPAFEALETALIKGFRDFDWMNRDPDLGPLRAFPEFRLLLEIYTPKKAEKSV